VEKRAYKRGRTLGGDDGGKNGRHISQSNVFIQSIQSIDQKNFKRLSSTDCRYFAVLALFRFLLPSSASLEGAVDAGGAVEVSGGRRAINWHLLFILLVWHDCTSFC
jgi:hypothetical protein